MATDGPTDQPPSQPKRMTEGPFAGWWTWAGGADPFETSIGPFCFTSENGRVRAAFEPRQAHLNGGGAIHGGALMSFADFALFALAHDELSGGQAVTMTFNAEFLSPGTLDGWIEADGEVLRAGRSLLFVRGLLSQTGRPVLAFSGTLKKIKA